LKFAIVRVLLTTGLGWIFAFYVPAWLGLHTSWGTAGLTLSAGLAGWVEFYLLRRHLNHQIGETGLALKYQLQLWLAALIGAGAGFALKILFGEQFFILRAAVSLGGYGVVYFLICHWLKIEHVKPILDKVLRRFRKPF
jgi:putative peptidoglycan lipid II flippase